MNIRITNDRLRHQVDRSAQRKSLTVFLLVLLIVVSALPAFAQKAELNPKIEIPNDYFYFGYMPRDAIVSHTYWIKNTGEDTLDIIKVKPGCGCTAAPLKQDKIAPGDSAELKVTFDSKLMRGKVVKDVSIFSNDPGAEVTSIKFFAVVSESYPPVVIDPPTLRFAKFGSKDDKLIKELTITNKSNHDMEVSVVELPEKYFTIDKQTVELGNDKKVVLTIEQVRTPTDEDDILTSMTLEFKGAETERVTVPIVSYFKRGE